jgi:hypothetical protein
MMWPETMSPRAASIAARDRSAATFSPTPFSRSPIGLIARVRLPFAQIALSARDHTLAIDVEALRAQPIEQKKAFYKRVVDDIQAKLNA